MNTSTISPSHKGYSPGAEKVTPHTFLIVTWLSTAISSVFLISRLLIHIRAFKRFTWDDLLVIAAWLILLVYSITWQVKSPVMDWKMDIEQGRKLATPEFRTAWNIVLPWLAVWNILFYCCLWAIKFAFLVFFYQLGIKANVYRAWWWVVLAITGAGLVASIGDYSYDCMGEKQIAVCASAREVHFNVNTLFANMAIDIFTDILILSIPILILRDVQKPFKRKMILYLLFSATIVIMIVAVIRAALVWPNSHAKTDLSINWMDMWSAIEMGVAIMIACVASFRQLFVSQKVQNRSNANRASRSRPLYETAARTLTLHKGSGWTDSEKALSESSIRTRCRTGDPAVFVQSTVDVSSESAFAEDEGSRLQYPDWDPVARHHA